MQLRSYCSFIPWTITQTRSTHILNIKLEIVVVLNNTCHPNMLKNTVNKGGGDFFERFLFYIITNLFITIFHLIPIKSGWLFFHTKYLWQIYKNIQQVFNKFWLSILNFICCMQHHYLKLEPHYFLMFFCGQYFSSSQ